MMVSTTPGQVMDRPMHTQNNGITRVCSAWFQFSSLMFFIPPCQPSLIASFLPSSFYPSFFSSFPSTIYLYSHPSFFLSLLFFILLGPAPPPTNPIQAPASQALRDPPQAPAPLLQASRHTPPSPLESPCPPRMERNSPLCSMGHCPLWVPALPKF